MSLNVLLLTALSIGLIHTLIGPDHYLPFIVLGRAEGWSVRKAVWWTFVCGLGHVLSSVVLGAIGVALGWAVTSMEAFEGLRGSIASWALIGFGLLYFLWGLWRGRRGHKHVHTHGDGSIHAHEHHHDAAEPRVEHGAQHMAAAHDDPGHLHAHRRSVWTLFIIFLLGPCEPLIPLLMVPAAQHSAWGVAAVAGVFGAVTILTMVTVVTLGLVGLRTVRFSGLERYVHAVAGATLLVSGLLVKVLGI